MRTQGTLAPKYGAPWYGSYSEIIKRINKQLAGETYTYNRQSFKPNGVLKTTLNQKSNSNKIIEIVNEIDTSKYLTEDPGGTNEKKTDLLQEYEMPTIEVVYILLN